MSKDLEKMSQRLDDFVTSVSGLMNRLEKDFTDITQQTRSMQKDINKLNENVLCCQREIGVIRAGQDSIQAALARTLFTTPRSEQDTHRHSSSSPAPSSGIQSTPQTSAPDNTPQAETTTEPTKLKMADYLKAKQSVFDVRVLNAFITATKATSKALLTKTANFVRPQPLPPGKFVTFSIGARMKLSKGNDSGYMGVGFKDRHLSAIVATLFGIPESEVTVALVNDLAKEFCNQVFGQAKSALSKDGIEYNITYPEIATGSQLDIRKHWGDAYLVLIFEMEAREFYVMFW